MVGKSLPDLFIFVFVGGQDFAHSTGNLAKLLMEVSQFKLLLEYWCWYIYLPQHRGKLEFLPILATDGDPCDDLCHRREGFGGSAELDAHEPTNGTCLIRRNFQDTQCSNFVQLQSVRWERVVTFRK